MPNPHRFLSLPAAGRQPVRQPAAESRTRLGASGKTVVLNTIPTVITMKIVTKFMDASGSVPNDWTTPIISAAAEGIRDTPSPPTRLPRRLSKSIKVHAISGIPAVTAPRAKTGQAAPEQNGSERQPGLYTEGPYHFPFLCRQRVRAVPHRVRWNVGAEQPRSEALATSLNKL